MTTKERLQEAGSVAYITHLCKLSADLCLGAEAKIATGKFGLNELRAHQEAFVELGKHLAYMQACAMLDGEAKP